MFTNSWMTVLQTSPVTKWAYNEGLCIAKLAYMYKIVLQSRFIWKILFHKVGLYQGFYYEVGLYIVSIEEDRLICIFGQKGYSNLWKNTKIQKGLTVRILGQTASVTRKKGRTNFHNEIFDPILEEYARPHRRISYYWAIKMMGA